MALHADGIPRESGSERGARLDVMPSKPHRWGGGPSVMVVGCDVFKALCCGEAVWQPSASPR
eukprot:3620830-Alexandrium_andersonii.AAC.1